MAKKSGMSLNPGADSTLVTAATRAALANVPRDLSGTFESVAKSYDATMQSVGKTWSEVAKVGTKLAKEAIGVYAQNKKYDAMSIGIQNADGARFLYDKLKELRSGISNTYFNPDKTEMKDGVEVPLENWRDLNKGKRMKLRQDKAKLEAQILSLNEGYNNIATRLENGEYDKGATGSNWNLINAIGAYKSSSGKTKDGYYVKPDMDENGDIFFTLYDQDNNVMQRGQEGSKSNITVKAGEIEGLLTPKNDAVVDEVNKLFGTLEVMGKTKGRNYANDGIIFERNFGRLIEDEDNMHILLDKELGMLGRSFSNDVSNADLQGGSVTSANIFRYSSKFVDSKGNPLKFEDVDGGGIGESDFQGEKGKTNYNKVVSALLDKTDAFYDEDVTRDTFKEWARSAGEATFNYGVGMRQKNAKENLGLDNDPFSAKSLGWLVEYPLTGGTGGGGTTQPYGELEKRRDDLLNFREVVGYYFEYKWDGEKWLAYDDGKKIDSVKDLDISNGISMKDIAKIEGLRKPTDQGYSIFDKTIASANKEEKDKKGSGVGISQDMLSNRENIEAELTKAYGENFFKKYTLLYALDVKKPRLGGLLGSRTVPSNKMQLRDKETNKVVYTFKTGNEATVDEANNMNDFFGEDFLNLLPGETTKP